MSPLEAKFFEAEGEEEPARAEAVWREVAFACFQASAKARQRRERQLRRLELLCDGPAGLVLD